MSRPTIRQELSIPSDLAIARQVQADIESALVALGYDERDLFAIRLALEEAFVNAVKHGNRLDGAKNVHICYATAADRFDIHRNIDHHLADCSWWQTACNSI